MNAVPPETKPEGKGLMTRCLACLAVCLALAGQAGAQSCSSYSRSYRSYSYAPSYSYHSPAKVYKAPVYKEKVVKVEAVYTNFLLAFPVVALPSYGAAYQEPAPAPAPGLAPPGGAQNPAQGRPPDAFQSQVLDQLKSLNTGLNALNQRVDKLERTRGPVPQRQPEAPPKEEAPREDDVRVDQAFHQRGKDERGRDIPETHGGGFVFTEANGRLARLTAELREEVQRQLQKGKMPMLNTKRAKDAGVKPLTKEGADAIFAAIDRQIALGGRKKEEKNDAE
jgi:hypothetical protein